MIQEYVTKFDAARAVLLAGFTAAHPADYQTIVVALACVLGLGPERVHKIDDGDYQGTLIFVIGELGYQPSRYWSMRVSYGSCSGCDVLQDIRGYSNDVPTSEQANDYLTLALHLTQSMKEV